MKTLKAELARKVQAYLARRITREDLAKWASQEFAKAYTANRVSGAGWSTQEWSAYVEREYRREIPFSTLSKDEYGYLFMLEMADDQALTTDDNGYHVGEPPPFLARIADYGT